VSWLADLHVDDGSTRAAAPELETRAAAHGERERRLRLAIGLLDLTTLNETDTDVTVRELCAQAVRPVPAPRGGHDAETGPPHVAAVCVFDRLVPAAREALAGQDVRVAAVAGGFPHPHPDRERRLEEVRKAVEAGADEIDAVITRDHALEGDWEALYEEVRDLRRACGRALLKAILAAGDLGSLDTVARAGLACCMAGADFIKTSTGRERINATLPIGMAMSAAIRRYRERSGHEVGLKAAGGIRTSEQALAWLQLAEEELGGEDALTPTRLRIGASSLLERLREGLSGSFTPQE
jgi:deoxyribose-phosphate aldolase